MSISTRARLSHVGDVAALDGADGCGDGCVGIRRTTSIAAGHRCSSRRVEAMTRLEREDAGICPNMVFTIFYASPKAAWCNHSIRFSGYLLFADPDPHQTRRIACRLQAFCTLETRTIFERQAEMPRI